MPDIPKRIYILEDFNGNTMNVPDDISFEDAFEKITAGYDVNIHTYILQPSRTVNRKDTPNG